MCVVGAQRTGWQDPAPVGVLTWRGWCLEAQVGPAHPSEGQRQVRLGRGEEKRREMAEHGAVPLGILLPGRVLTAESPLAREAGPSEGRPPPVLPSVLDCSAPGTDWGVMGILGSGHPHLPLPSLQPTRLTRTDLTTPRGTGRCSLTLSAWLQREQVSRAVWSHLTDVGKLGKKRPSPNPGHAGRFRRPREPGLSL